MSKFRTPPKPKTADDFVSSAPTQPAKGGVAVQVDDLPEPGGPRAGALSLRLTRREAAMLRILAENTPRSQHQIVLDALLPVLEAEYQKLMGK